MRKVIVFLIFTNFLFSYEELSVHNFDEKIKGKNAIIDFYASWCPPCKILANNLEDFEIIKPDGIEIFKVNIDNQMVLAKKYGVSKLPTMVYFKNGKPINNYVGILSVEELAQTVKENFK